MKNYLSRNISTIFIMLGHECNLQCKYCLQHDVSNIILNKDFSEDILDFVMEMANNQPNNIVQIQFYGGEPLVFWDTIVKFVNGIIRRGKPRNLRFSMITNGKLLDKDKVTYINDNFDNIAISWDGRNVLKTRGYDVFAENKENIFALKRFAISGVLSAYNYIQDFLEDCENINREYVEKYNGHTISVNVDDLLDVNMENEDLKKFDLDKVYQQIHSICNEYKEFAINHKTISIIKKNYIENKINYVRGAIRNNHVKPNRDRCGNGYEVLNIDLNGNLYKCHNTNQIVGTIYDNYYDVIKKVLELDSIEKNSSVCDKCAVQILCMDGCPLVSQQARSEYYCVVINIMNYPILELITELGSEMEDGRPDN